MIVHPAIRFLVLTRWKNRVRSTLAKVRTPTGLLSLVLIVAVVVGLYVGGRFGEELSAGEREGAFLAILAFLMLMGFLSGIGQRGLVFLAADIDYLFPAPIPRRQLLAYHFVPHYLAALFLGLVYLLLLGGRFMPNPGLFLLGVALCQVTNAHLGALAAELSMLVTDSLYRRLRRFTTALTVVFVALAMVLVVGAVAGLGDVLVRVEALLATPLARIVFFPAVQAVALGVEPGPASQALAFLALLGCAVGSFLLVVSLRIDFVESSFVATRQAWKKVEQMRRGAYGGRVSGSARTPRGPWFRGAGAILWLNLLTMRRQLRATLGGLLVVLVMLAMFSRESRGPSLAGTILVMLGMVPLWMPLPIGFRLPREQLLLLRELPLPPTRLAAALLTVPVLVPFVLQTFAVIALAALGRLHAGLAVAALPTYAAIGVTLVAVESLFVLRRPHPNTINLLHSMAQILLQLAALAPGLVAAVLVLALGGGLPLALPGASLVQAAVAVALARFLGGRLQAGAVAASQT